MKRGKITILTAQLLLVTTLCGCAETYRKSVNWMNSFFPEVTPGKTISADSKWINSDVDGAVDETVVVSEKDDFHTAVNRQWLLDTEVTDATQQESTFRDAVKVQHEMDLKLLEKDNTAADTAMISQEGYEHLQSLTSDLASLWMDWEKRNERGAEPIRGYIETIQKADSLDALTACLTDPNGCRQLALNMLNVTVEQPVESKERYAVYLSPCSGWILGSQASYSSTSGTVYEIKDYNKQAAGHVLGQLGYEEDEINRILQQAYRLESRLAEGTLSAEKQAESNYLESYLNESCTEQEILELAGNYPLQEILESMGLADCSQYGILESEYLKHLGKVYTEKNLEELKSYCIMQTVLEFLPYLDEESYALDQSLQDVMQEDEELSVDTENEEDESEEEKAKEEALGVEENLIADVLDELYIVRYLDSEDKEFLEDMTQEMIGYYRTMLLDEEWLSEETRQKAAEKLDAITCRILYPEHLQDFTELSYDAEGSLPEAVNAIDSFRIGEMEKSAEQPIDKDKWQIQTRTTNAMYIPSDNSINICAGIIAGGYLYDAEASAEQNLGSIGMIIGHEITHAFDTTGYLYDKDGILNRWWSKEDEENFQLRANKVSKFYSALTPLNAAYDGSGVQGEVIADMGGMKCVLGLAKTRENFDYQEFFRAYARIWRTKNSYYMENSLIKTDVHPVAFLRTNVTVQQFEEFMEAFDIHEGDGMYLAEEDRINVW